MSSTSLTRKALTAVFAGAVLIASVQFGIGFAAAVDGQCTEDAVQGAAFVAGGAAIGGPVGATAGAVVGAGYFIGSQFVDPCATPDSTLTDDELTDVTDNTTYEKSVAVIDNRANEERLIDAVLSKPEYSRNAIWSEAELQFADTYLNNGTESESINAGRSEIKNATQNDIGNLIAKQYRDVGNAQNAYSRLAEINQTGLIHVYAGGSEVDTSGGITFNVPNNSTDTDGHQTYTLEDGSTMAVASVTANGSTYDYRDDLAVTMENPRDASKEVPLVGQDMTNKVGATQYNPSDDGYSPSTADIVVAKDGSGGYTNIETALDNAVSGDTVYIKNGTYKPSTSMNYFDASTNTKTYTIIADGAVLDAQGTDRFISLGTNSTVKGLTVKNQQYYAYTGGSNITIEKNTVHGSPIVQGGDGTISNTIHDSSESAVTTGTYTVDVSPLFTSFTKSLVTQQSDLRSEMLGEWGDATNGGYGQDIWNQLQTDTLAITDVVTYQQMFSQSFDQNSRAFYDSQYLQADMTGQPLDSTAVVEVQPGSTAYANTQLSKPVPIDSEQTYEGHIWTMNPPSSGTWEQNTTYNTSDLGGPVYITYHDQQETLNEDGSISVESVPSTVMVKGEFQFSDIINENGTSVETIEHGGEPRVDIYNSSSYREEVEQTSQQNDELTKQLAQDGGTTTSSECIVDLPIIGCITSIGTGGIIGTIALLIGVYAFASRGIPGIIAALKG